MKPLRLYIEDFMCYDFSFINFTEFNSAIIIGFKEKNELFANGVGKTTIFKAIEYVLFNQSDFNLDKIIRDDTDYCKVTLDFEINGQEYRISRKRTKKGNTDLCLLERNLIDGTENEIYHSIDEKPHSDNKKYWKDLSGGRASDTEKDLAKLLRLNPKSFRSTIHFVQNDFTGLSTATPEKRKALLKDAYNLIIYSKLEKLSKDKNVLLTKEINQLEAMAAVLGNPDEEIKALNKNLESGSLSLQEQQGILHDKNSLLTKEKSDESELKKQILTLESEYSEFLAKKQTLNLEKISVEKYYNDYFIKANNTSNEAKVLIDTIASKKEAIKSMKTDFSALEVLASKLDDLKRQGTENNITIKNNIEKYEDLKIPLPTGSACKSCRKSMTDLDRENHKLHIDQEMKACQDAINNCKIALSSINKEIAVCTNEIQSLNKEKALLAETESAIKQINKEILDKQELYKEYKSSYKKLKLDLENKVAEITINDDKLNKSSKKEVDKLNDQLIVAKHKIAEIQDIVNGLNKQIFHFSNANAVQLSLIEQKTKDSIKLLSIKEKLVVLNKKQVILNLVIQGYSSTGIPNLIIQNVLDNLQIASNDILDKLKPGGKDLQLSFFVEKKNEKTGEQSDTLDINYFVNGKPRYYEQLSGAMKIAVMFSLKLGLSFVLQEEVGSQIKLLLLDEIDQSLDKASVDALAEMIKFFQKDLIILIITHNDRLKDKFSHTILVEQDMNMISKARVINGLN